tara:strand:- start:2118 stop:2294 length:177 start_codon:yes stop_codon:yes gene_type:complete
MVNSGKEWDWMDDESKKQTEAKKEITNLADEISFRLLATKDHPEYEWLIKRLEEKWKE